MTFLNPLVLFGLAAAAIPILIHLLSRRKLRTIEFSSLRFLKELQHTSIRRLKIRQMLLLILRILLIVTLVMTFARPVLQGPLAGALGGSTTTTLVIILDDSPSMGVRNEQGELFTQGRDAVARILDLAAANDRVTLTTLSATSRTDSLGAPEPPAVARRALSKFTLSQTSVPLFAALRKARHTLSLNPAANREVYVITDRQASQCAVPDADRDTAVADPDPTRIFLISPPAGPQQNAGILSIDILSRILSVGRPVSMQATVQNAGNQPLREAVLSIYLDGSRVGQHSLDLAPHTTTVVPFSVVPKRRGILAGSCTLEDDALEADNQAHFVLSIPPRVRVALSGPTQAETKFAYLALTLAGDTTLSGAVAVTRIDAEKLQSTDLEVYDAVVLCGVRDFTQAVADRLVPFVTNGKGLLFFPGDGMNIRSFNETLANRLSIPPLPPPPPLQATGGTEHSGSFLTFGKIDFAHPLFAGLFQSVAGRRGENFSIESPEIRKTIGLSTAGSGAAIIQMGNGEPFLAEYRPGNGRVLCFAVEAAPGWSTFPLKGIFAPLLHRSVLYVASGDPSSRRFTTGDRLILSVRRSSVLGQSPDVVVAPSGLEERVAPRYRATTGTLAFETFPATETGIYALRRAGQGANQDPLDAVAVDIPARETDLRPADAAELARLWSSVGIAQQRVITLSTSDELERTIRESRYGMELWKYFAGLALLLALGEMLVGRNWQGRPAPDEGGMRG
jgi:Aerotolerance regulator N-terminal/von Willebrand factor type A domain/CARDB